MAKTFDASARFLLDARPADWLRFLRLGADEPVQVVNAELSTVTVEADKVLRVEAAEPWLLHIELQSSHDRTLGARLLRYNVLLHHRDGLPVHSVAVLLRRDADSPAIGGQVERLSPDGRCRLEFQYQVVRVWQEPLEPILAGPLGTLPLAPLTDEATRRLPEVLGRIDQRYREQLTPIQRRELWRATGLLMGLRHPPEEINQMIADVMKDSSVYQHFVEKGRVQGLAEGEAKGLAEGEAKGRAAEARSLLLRLGEVRFGPPAQAVRDTIEAIDDRDRLERLALRLLTVEGWDEFLIEG